MQQIDATGGNSLRWINEICKAEITVLLKAAIVFVSVDEVAVSSLVINTGLRILVQVSACLLLNISIKSRNVDIPYDNPAQIVYFIHFYYCPRLSRPENDSSWIEF